MMRSEPKVFRNVVRDFWLQLRGKSLETLRAGVIFLIFYCDHGKHRSLAAATLFAYCLLLDKFMVNTTSSYVLKFNQSMWSKGKCGGLGFTCCACDTPVDQRRAYHHYPHYIAAVDIFRQERE